MWFFSDTRITAPSGINMSSGCKPDPPAMMLLCDPARKELPWVWEPQGKFLLFNFQITHSATGPNPGSCNKKAGRFLPASSIISHIRILLFLIKLHRFTCGLKQFIFFLAAHNHILELTQSCSGWYRVPCNYIFLQSKHVICFTLDGC
jgi:hypothetical protein